MRHPQFLIYLAAEKGSSGQPAFIHSHTGTVPGRMVTARLFTGLPRRVLLGNLAFTLRAKKVVRLLPKHAGNREALPTL
jgi:hypothetical protein